MSVLWFSLQWNGECTVAAQLEDMVRPLKGFWWKYYSGRGVVNKQETLAF